MADVVIVGGGIAGYRALQRILEIDPACDLVLISDEDQPAYERPMLSKELLTSDIPLRSVKVREDFPNLRQVFRQRVTSIDREAREVVTTAGETISYRSLILATGSRPRIANFPGVKADDIIYLRTASDAERLSSKLAPDTRIAIIGGGFIGLEVAAAARKRGAQAIVFEAQDRLLARVAPPSLSDWLNGLHSDNGVTIKLNSPVKDVKPTMDGRFEIQTCGSPITVDHIVVGVGILPNTELAERCGLVVNDGIVVDAACQTSDPNIFAAGDVASYRIANHETPIRSECWTVAFDQGTAAGQAAMGHGSAVYNEIPWLWSDQYETSIQYLGLPLQGVRTSRHAGDNDGSWLELAWREHGQFAGAIGVNANKQIAEIRRAFRKGLPVPSKYLEAIAVG